MFVAHNYNQDRLSHSQHSEVWQHPASPSHPAPNPHPALQLRALAPLGTRRVDEGVASALRGSGVLGKWRHLLGPRRWVTRAASGACGVDWAGIVPGLCRARSLGALVPAAVTVCNALCLTVSQIEHHQPGFLHPPHPARPTARGRLVLFSLCLYGHDCKLACSCEKEHRSLVPCTQVAEPNMISQPGRHRHLRCLPPRRQADSTPVCARVCGGVSVSSLWVPVQHSGD